MEDKSRPIIIKKVKKGHAAAHGGSWKVAYADFVTAMMAFFLLMWLLSMVSPEKRAVMALYFKNFSLFEHGGKSFMQDAGVNPFAQSGGQEYYETEEESKSGGNTSNEELKGKLLTAIQEKTQGVRENLVIETSPAGVRIQIVDRKETPIFPAGSAQLTEQGKKVVALVAGTLKNLPNDIILEGHTDASVTKNEQMSNWELSALRACAARREFELDGVGSDRISRVVGYANKVPLFGDDPEDPRNRRISVVFLYGKAQKPANPYDWVWKVPPGKK